MDAALLFINWGLHTLAGEVGRGKGPNPELYNPFFIFKFNFFITLVIRGLHHLKEWSIFSLGCKILRKSPSTVHSVGRWHMTKTE